MWHCFNKLLLCKHSFHIVAAITIQKINIYKPLVIIIRVKTFPIFSLVSVSLLLFSVNANAQTEDPLYELLKQIPSISYNPSCTDGSSVTKLTPVMTACIMAELRKNIKSIEHISVFEPNESSFISKPLMQEKTMVRPHASASFGGIMGNVYAAYPNEITINRQFTIEYGWYRPSHHDSPTGAYIPNERYMPDGANLTIVLPPWVEFVDSTVYENSALCGNYVHYKFNPYNKTSHEGSIDVKYTKTPFGNPDKDLVESIAVLFGDGTSFLVYHAADYTNHPANQTIRLAGSDSFIPVHAVPARCDQQNSIPRGQASNIVPTGITEEIPKCITKYQWDFLNNDEKDFIMYSNTTCTVIDGKTQTNLPQDWHRTGKMNYEKLADFIDRLDPPGSVGEFFRSEGMGEGWVDDFTSYYKGLSKQSHDFFFHNLA